MAAELLAVRADHLNKATYELRKQWSNQSDSLTAWYAFNEALLQAGEGAWVASTEDSRTQQTRQLAAGNSETTFDRNLKSFIREVFDLGTKVQLSPALSHPAYENYWNDYLWLEANLIRRLKDTRALSVLNTATNEVIYPSNRNSSSVIVGGAVVHGLAQIALEYDLNFQGGKYDLQRRRNPTFILPFEYFSHHDRNPRKELGLERSSAALLSGAPSWGIRDINDGYEYLADPEEGKVFDHLLMTVLPNVFDTQAYENNFKNVVAGGCHIVGTSAIDLVFSDVSILKFLAKKTERMQYWQAVVPVSKFEKKAGIPFASKVDIAGIQVKAIETDDRRLGEFLAASSKWTEQAKRFWQGFIPNHKNQGSGSQHNRNQNDLRLVSIDGSSSKGMNSPTLLQETLTAGSQHGSQVMSDEGFSYQGEGNLTSPLLTQLDQISFLSDESVLSSDPRAIQVPLLRELDAIELGERQNLAQSRSIALGFSSSDKSHQQDAESTTLKSVAHILGARIK